MKLDHIVLAAPDLDAAKDAFEETCGVRPNDGGQHVGLGTRNALVSFGDGAYLEIVAPDPEQSLEGNFGAVLAALPHQRVLHWALAVTGLEAVARTAADCGFAPGPIRDTSRAQPNGELLEWQLLGLGGHEDGGLVPFFIDWLQCPHPSTTNPVVGPLTQCTIALPDSHALHQLLDPTPEGMQLTQGDASFTATFDSPNGEIVYTASELGGFRM